jgi:hypothetical protein
MSGKACKSGKLDYFLFARHPTRVRPDCGCVGAVACERLSVGLASLLVN